LIALLLTLALSRPFVDDSGRKVELPDHPTRVLAAGPPAQVWVYALAPEALLGWTRALEADELALIAEPYRKLPVLGRMTGRHGTASPETWVNAKPDLIVDIGTVDATYRDLADRMQAQMGIPYVLLGGSLADSGTTFRKLGKVLGREAQAEELAIYVDGLLASAKAAQSGPKPRTYHARGPAGLQTALAGSIFAEFLTLAGAENVAPAGGTDAIVTQSLEAVAKSAPAVIVTQNAEFTKQYAANPVWQSLHARFLVAPSAPFGWLDSPPSVNRVLGVVWLTDKLYPGRVKLDMSATIKEFYARLYHVQVDPGRFTK
jgi:iron complex transport system substrate-binding protein